MNYLTIEQVSKSYGEKLLLDDVTLHINQADKVALVAQNGSGKTTLLRLIAGEERPEGEHARVLLHRDVRTGYLPQEPLFGSQDTVLDAIFDTTNPVLSTVRNYEAALLHPEDPQRLQAAMAAMEDQQAWDFEATIKEVLFKLHITDLEQPVNQLSGGQRKRLALARLIIDEPDFLILDEPTNHLDLAMIEWLEDYLSRPGLTVFMVTHDRYFLERVCTHIVELERGQLFKYSGGYSDYLHKKTTRQENERLDKQKAQALMRKELVWIRRMPKARGTKAKARIDAFQDLKERAHREVDQDLVRLDIRGTRLGSKILELQYISKTYGDQHIVRDFHYKFKKNERVGIVGPNGSGKTTLLRLMTGEIRPDRGKVVTGETVRFGHYSQDGLILEQDKRVHEVVTNIAEYIPLSGGQKLSASQLLERFMFDRAQQQVFVSQLSGGERRRLYLLTVLMANPNFLILDEPTNDLDIITLNVLEDFLQQFPGCVVIVTHDRYFMDKLVDHVFVFEDDGTIRDFPGNYTQYRIWKTDQAPATPAPQPKKQRVRTDKITPLTEEQRKELKRLEREINRYEQRKAEIMAAFHDDGLSPDEINTLSEELGRIDTDLDAKEARWLELAEIADG